MCGELLRSIIGDLGGNPDGRLQGVMERWSLIIGPVLIFLQFMVIEYKSSRNYII